MQKSLIYLMTYNRKNMKGISMFIIFLAITITGFCQDFIKEGDCCFDSGDYDCAVINYKAAFDSLSGLDQQKVEIKLTRAKWCNDHIIAAKQKFDSEEYMAAKEEYLKVLESNPRDYYAKLQIMICDNLYIPPPVETRKATSSEIKDIRNGKYGVVPYVDENLLSVGIDAADALRRINNGEGKTEDPLSVSRKKLVFESTGGSSEPIAVKSVSNYFYIPSNELSYWCSVKKNNNSSFTVKVKENPTYSIRKSWFVVKSEDEEVVITITQAANNQPPKVRKKRDLKQFNRPKNYETWGINMGYTQHYNNIYCGDAVHLGLSIEPLLKYGFGIYTGVNIVGFTNSSLDTEIFKHGFDMYSVNIPMHLEYRLNFSKWFNVFGYGGPGLYAITDKKFKSYTFPVSIDYGGGIRICHIQIKAGQSMYLGNFRNISGMGENIYPYQRLKVSVSYMF